jgi:translation initiation factor 1 (eIF-1/SUI1)
VTLLLLSDHEFHADAVWGKHIIIIYYMSLRKGQVVTVANGWDTLKLEYDKTDCMMV